MSGILLIYHFGEQPLNPGLIKVFPKQFLNNYYLSISDFIIFFFLHYTIIVLNISLFINILYKVSVGRCFL